MQAPEIWLSFVYAVFCLCFVLPPQELVAAGLTIENIFRRYMGDEAMNFVLFHIKRSIITLLCHCLLPAGYTLILMYCVPRTYIYGFLELSDTVRILIVATLLFPFLIGAICYYWSRNNFDSHPIAKKLSALAEGQETWRDVAALINVEKRRPETFQSGHYSRKVYVTENWIVRIGTYNLDVVHQRNCVLSLQQSTEMNLSSESPHGLQFLHVSVEPIGKTLPNFTIVLKSTEYAEMKQQLQAPLVNARNVLIKQTVTEQFIEAFREQISLNPVYTHNVLSNGNVDNCLGCMINPADVKLVKNCPFDHMHEAQNECTSCHCRPLWCVSCLARWFASRQDQSNTSNWLSSKCLCPMCRANFCMADVSKVRVINAAGDDSGRTDLET